MALLEAHARLVLQIPTIHLAETLHVFAILDTMAPVEAHAVLARLYLMLLTMALELLLPTARTIATWGI